MGGMRAVHEVVGGAASGASSTWRMASPSACPEGVPVGLDRERHGDGQVDSRCGAGDADRFLGVGHGDGAHHVGARVGERPSLQAVVVGGLGADITVSMT